MRSQVWNEERLAAELPDVYVDLPVRNIPVLTRIHLGRQVGKNKGKGKGKVKKGKGKGKKRSSGKEGCFHDPILGILNCSDRNQ